MTSKLQWGVLGTSFISGVMVNAIKSEGRSQVRSVAGRDRQRLDSFASEHGIPKRFSDFDALLQDPEVDIIYVALPNHLHHEYSIKAAQAGKSVLCEKSLSTNMSDTDAMAKHCTKHFFAEGLMYLHHPLITQLTSLVKDPEFGELKAIEGHYVADIANFVNPGSKGALFNLGCYPVSLAYVIVQHLFGEDIWQDYRLTAQGYRGKDGNLCEASLQMQLKNRLQLRLHTAETYGLHHGFTLLGSKGVIRLATNPWLPEAKNNCIEYGQYEKPLKQLVVSADGDGFYYQVRHIIDALQQQQDRLAFPCASLNDSVQIMKILCNWHDAIAD